MIKKTIILFITAILIAIIPLNVFAKYDGIDTGIHSGDTEAIRSSVEITSRIVGTLQVAGSIISVVALIIIGIRYMFSSIEDKASMKGVLIYYIIGAVLVFATTNVVGFAYDIISSLN